LRHLHSKQSEEKMQGKWSAASQLAKKVDRHPLSASFGINFKDLFLFLDKINDASGKFKNQLQPSTRPIEQGLISTKA